MKILLFICLFTTICCPQELSWYVEKDVTISFGTAYMYNFVTEEYNEVLLDTTQNFTMYIPQILPALNLYDLYIVMGHEPIDAFKKVLLTIVKEKK